MLTMISGEHLVMHYFIAEHFVPKGWGGGGRSSHQDKYFNVVLASIFS